MYKYRRIIAYLIDIFVVLIAVGFALRIDINQLAMSFAQGIAGFEAASADSIILIFVIPIILYGCMTGYFGWTPGKLAMGLRVLAIDGEPIGIKKGLLREAIKCAAFNCLIFGLVWAVYGIFTEGRAFYDNWLSILVEDHSLQDDEYLSDVQRKWREYQDEE